MLWTAMSVAWAGDLDGWAGQPWGSFAGGPKDPAIVDISADPKVIGDAKSVLISGRPLASAEFLGKPAKGTAQYYEGQLAEVRVVVSAPHLEVLPLLESRLGPPLALGTGWVFGNGTTTVGVGSVGTGSEGTQIMLVSNQHRARCLETMGEQCTLYASKAEMEGHIASNPQLAAATRQASAPSPGTPPPQRVVVQIEPDRALLERNMSFIEAEVRTCLQIGPLDCAPAKAKLVEYWTAHPELRPKDDAACKARTLPAKCWRW